MRSLRELSGVPWSAGRSSACGAVEKRLPVGAPPSGYAFAAALGVKRVFAASAQLESAPLDLDSFDRWPCSQQAQAGDESFLQRVELQDGISLHVSSLHSDPRLQWNGLRDRRGTCADVSPHDASVFGSERRRRRKVKMSEFGTSCSPVPVDDREFPDVSVGDSLYNGFVREELDLAHVLPRRRWVRWQRQNRTLDVEVSKRFPSGDERDACVGGQRPELGERRPEVDGVDRSGE
jgi:hypothetical protein